MGKDCKLWYGVVARYHQASKYGSGFAEVFRLTLADTRMGIFLGNMIPKKQKVYKIIC